MSRSLLPSCILADGRISLAEAEAMYADAMTELMPPVEPPEPEEDNIAPTETLGSHWRRLDSKPDNGDLELKIEKLAEDLEGGQLHFAPEEVRRNS